MDGRLVLLGLIVVLAGAAARNLDPVRPAGADAAERASERALDAALVDVDHTQQCYFRRRDRYADAKRELAGRTWKYMHNYADAKDEIVREITARIQEAAP